MGERVAGLALYEIPYDRDPAAREAFERYKKDVAELLARDEREETVALFVKSVGVTDKQIQAMQSLPLWKSLAAMAPTVQYDTVEIMERYPAIDARAIGTKTLVMYGAASPPFMAETAHDLVRAMPHATLLSLEGQTHDVEYAVLAPALAAFFE